VAGLTSLELLGRWRDQGDQNAATELFNRYVNRLVALARAKLAPALAQRLEADDVVQSACNSFFLRVRDGRLLVQPGGELWDLLAAITLNKVLGQAEHHAAKKRSIKREVKLADGESVCWLDIEAIAHDPGAGEQLALLEECEKAMSGLAPVHRRIVELRLEQLTTTEIAAKVGRSDRMVRLVLSDFGKRLQKRFAELNEP